MAKEVKIKINKDTLINGKKFSSLYTLAIYVKKNNLNHILFETFILDNFFCSHCKKQIKEKSVKFKITKELVVFYNVVNEIACSISCVKSLTNKLRYKQNPQLSKLIATKSGNTQRGRKLENAVGIEKAKQMKKQFSYNASKFNPRWSPKHRTPDEIKKQKKIQSKYLRDKFLDKTWEEVYGKEKADEMKKKLSKANSGKNNSMYGKSPSKLSGNGISGKIGHLFFRSLLELSFLLDNYNSFEFIKNAEKKQFHVKYLFENKTFTYKPDFYLVNSNEIIEIKPSHMLKNDKVKAKIKYAKERFGSNFKIKTEKDVSRIKKHKVLIAELMKSNILEFHKTKRQRAINAIQLLHVS